jgi:hypothetical protein
MRDYRWGGFFQQEKKRKNLGNLFIVSVKSREVDIRLGLIASFSPLPLLLCKRQIQTYDQVTGVAQQDVVRASRPVVVR